MDPGHDGVYVGWADRLAGHLKAVHPDLLYANLAVRGRLAPEVREEQLPLAVAMQPHIAVAVSGVNDVLRPRFDADRLRDDLHAIHGELAAAGAKVVTFTMPDMGSVAPIAIALRPRFAALNVITRDLADRFGTVVVDLDREPVASHPALWDDDRLHGNSEGHRRIALALAEALDVPVSDDWRAPLPDVPRRGALGRDAPPAVGRAAHARSVIGGRHHLQAPRAAAGVALCSQRFEPIVLVRTEEPAYATE
jgi:lysophospholipase L1-like esterase